MLTKRSPGLQVFLAMLALWHTIEAVLVGLIVLGFVRVNSDKLFMFES